MILTYYCIVTMIIIAYLLGSIPSAVWIRSEEHTSELQSR